MMSEWVVQFDDPESKSKLSVALRLLEQKYGERPLGLIYQLVGLIAGLKIEVFSNEHPPPHFRVVYNGESANYSIRDCEHLNGGLRRYYGVIKAWHAENKMKLIEIWNERRPTDCPVGPYRE